MKTNNNVIPSISYFDLLSPESFKKISNVNKSEMVVDLNHVFMSMSQDNKSLEMKSQEEISELQALLNAEWTELQQNEAITMRQKMGSLDNQASTSMQQEDQETDLLDCESLPSTSSAPSNIVTYVNSKKKFQYWTVKLMKQSKKKSSIFQLSEEDDEEEEDADKKSKIQSTAPTIDDEIWQVDD